MHKGLVAGLMMAVVAVGSVAMPKPAEAYWVRGGYGYGYGWRRPVVVVPGPVFVPRPVVVGVPYRYWVRPHYTRFGYFVPGHWQ